MHQQFIYMKRCLELAAKGLGHVAPNPMVGSVVVHNDKMIGEGYHQHYGEVHAEVNAINSIKDQELLKRSTLYVSLEPCAHHGKTPPCVDLIIQKKIPHVVIGSVDSNPVVSGKGIEKLKSAGIKVEYGVLENECRELNKRFYTFHEKKRPYIILKWAQTKDGFIDKHRSVNEAGQQLKISTEAATLLVHEWRSQEQAIMVGTNTALLDNPKLSVRSNVPHRDEARNPIRIVIDKELKIPAHYHLMSGSSPTLVFTNQKRKNEINVEYITMKGTGAYAYAEKLRQAGEGREASDDFITNILSELYKRNIQSVLVEGGTKLINSFIEQNLWDEARVIINETTIQKGVKAPELRGLSSISEIVIGKDTILFYSNKSA